MPAILAAYSLVQGAAAATAAGALIAGEVG
ncbi:hypothetical protein ABIA33_000503 [Streptacidiphilus sp. MAP12-16]